METRKLKKRAGQVSKIFLFIGVSFSLFLSGCSNKDKDNNLIFVPDFLEFWHKSDKPAVVKAKSYKPVKAVSTPVSVPKKVVVEDNSIGIQDRIIKTAEKYLYVRETGGNNRSPEIDYFCKTTGIPIASFWCGALIYTVFVESGIKNLPKGAGYTPNWFNKPEHNINFKDLKKGSTIGYFFPKLDGNGRIGHIGVFTGEKREQYYVVIEGNTSGTDSLDSSNVVRNADGGTGGVFKKLRNKKLLEDKRNKFSKWY